jgi:hypothetical protein
LPEDEGNGIDLLSIQVSRGAEYEALQYLKEIPLRELKALIKERIDTCLDCAVE